jgi:hypothetical protein
MIQQVQTDFIQNTMREMRSNSLAWKNQAEAVQWMRSKIGFYKRTDMFRMGHRFATSLQPGNLYFFIYDPKYKNKLPYFDKFPLIFPLSSHGDHFMGLNMHYLNPASRIMLLGNVLGIYQRYGNDTQRINMAVYSLITNASKRSNVFNICVKKYLYSHVRSKFLTVEANEFPYASFLPFENFEKASKQFVWSDSLRKA